MFQTTPLEGLLIYTPKIFNDNRGYFTETYNQKVFQEAGIPSVWVQDNLSLSRKNVLRGLHFQKNPFAQAKLVSIVKGAAFDVAVDLRPSSKTYGKWFGIELNDKELKYLYIPRGFAHGFLSLSDETCFSYKVDQFYAATSDAGIHYADPEINIQWPVPHDKLTLSAKDLALPTLSQFTANLE